MTLFSPIRWRGPLITVAAKQTLFLWLLFASSLYILAFSSGIIDEESNNVYLSDFHRRGLHAKREYDGYTYTSFRSKKGSMPGEINTKLTNDRMTIAQKDKVQEKIKKRKQRREEIELQNTREGVELSRTFDFSAKNFSTYPILPSNRVLPDMTTDKGGVIFFLHIPKTGGQTIRHSFGRKHLSNAAKQRMMKEMLGNQVPKEETLNVDDLLTPTLMSKVRFILANRLDAFLKKAVPKVNRFLSGTTNWGKILMVEVHGMDNFDALELEPYLQAWRQRSKETNVPFFAFTVLREGVSEQVSFFNFYFIHPGDTRFCDSSITTSTRCRKQSNVTEDDDDASRPGEAELLESTLRMNAGIDLEDAMVKSIYDNPQCLFLARGERTYGSDAVDLRQSLDREECETTYQSLQRTMDWIGRTDTLQSETLPLLTTIMFKRPTIGENLQKSNASPKKKGFVALSKIHDTTREALVKSSRLDQELYEQVVRDYRIDQWGKL